MSYSGGWYKTEYAGYTGAVLAINKASADAQFKGLVDSYHHSLHRRDVRAYIEREYSTVFYTLTQTQSSAVGVVGA